MDKKVNEEITIYGAVDVRNNPVTLDDFNNMFIDWIESNGWFFGGGIDECKG